MDINLLPIGYTKLRKRDTKFYQVQTISIYLLLLLIFVTSITVALRFLQTQQIKAAEANLQEFNLQVSSLKSKEASLVILKDRLTTIDQISTVPSKQRSVYNLVNGLIPPNLTLSFVSVDRSGNMLLSIVAPNFSSLDGLLATLGSTQKNENKITSTSLESFSRSRDGLYRASLKIVPK